MAEEQSSEVRLSGKDEGPERETPAPLRADDVPERAGSLSQGLEPAQVLPSSLQDDIPARAGEHRKEGEE